MTQPARGAATVRALFQLSRPSFSFWMLGVPMIGYGVGHWDRALAARNASALPWMLASWYVLGAATLWLNAALDEDEGGALFARATARPKHVDRYGYAGLAVAIALAAPAGRGVFACSALCFVLSVL